jgi:hypothetical protein
MVKICNVNPTEDTSRRPYVGDKEGRVGTCPSSSGLSLHSVMNGFVHFGR